MRRRRSHGQSLVETTLILTAFMGLLVGMIDVGQMLFAREALAERVRDATRWGAMNPFDAAAIRNMVLYGTASPAEGAAPFVGLAEPDVVVSNPGCPGVDCRVTVAIPGHGIQSTEPAGDY